jgi:hypothetical protein
LTTNPLDYLFPTSSVSVLHNHWAINFETCELGQKIVKLRNIGHAISCGCLQTKLQCQKYYLSENVVSNDLKNGKRRVPYLNTKAFFGRDGYPRFGVLTVVTIKIMVFWDNTV